MSNVKPCSWKTRARPPGWSWRSSTFTLRPNAASWVAAAIPAKPAPMTKASQLWEGDCCSMVAKQHRFGRCSTQTSNSWPFRLAEPKRYLCTMENQDSIFDLCAFGAHPDDVELGCGGTIAKEVASGRKVGILDLTRGELGTRGTAEIRDKEAAKAAEILGVVTRENLRFRDGFFVNDEKHQLEIIKMIRKYKPEIVLCNAIDDRHIDHGKGSKLVSDACFLSGLMKIETDFDGLKQEAWRPKQVYHYIQWKNIEPDFAVDVTGFMDKKKESVMAYSSQFYDPNSKELDTPISSKNFTDSVQYRSKELGRLIGVDHAEGFTVERSVAVTSLNKLI